jgi:hypothetical protein
MELPEVQKGLSRKTETLENDFGFSLSMTEQSAVHRIIHDSTLWNPSDLFILVGSLGRLHVYTVWGTTH